MPRGRPRKNPTYKITVHPEFDIRDKGRKSDEDLLAEYRHWLDSLHRYERDGVHWLIATCIKHLEAIETELGKERIQDERIRLLEEKLSVIEEDRAPPRWVIPTALLAVLISGIITFIEHIFW